MSHLAHLGILDLVHGGFDTSGDHFFGKILVTLTKVNKEGYFVFNMV
jgi:hypothetical protein